MHKLTQDDIDFVKHLARRFVSQRDTREADFVSWGLYGLLEAALSYDPNFQPPVAWSTWRYRQVRNRIVGYHMAPPKSLIPVVLKAGPLPADEALRGPSEKYRDPFLVRAMYEALKHVPDEWLGDLYATWADEPSVDKNGKVRGVERRRQRGERVLRYLTEQMGTIDAYEAYIRARRPGEKHGKQTVLQHSSER